MNKKYFKLKKRVQIWLVIFMCGLILSGITAFPIETQLQYLVDHPNITPDFVESFIAKALGGVQLVNNQYPFISYGTDWLAFAHIVIAVVFIGPIKDPVKNIWVIQFGMIACIMVFPLALIAGPIREIPFYWQLIDCSFGLIGGLIIFEIYRMVKSMEQIIIK